MKRRRHSGAILQPAVEGASGLAQLAQGGGVDAGNLRVLGYLVEESQDGGRIPAEQLGVHRIDEAAAQLEFVADAAHVHGGVAENGLVKQLQQHLVELGHPSHRLVEALHHLLDRAVALALEPQHLGHGALAVEQEAVVPLLMAMCRAKRTFHRKF